MELENEDFTRRLFVEASEARYLREERDIYFIKEKKESLPYGYRYEHELFLNYSLVVKKIGALFRNKSSGLDLFLEF